MQLLFFRIKKKRDLTSRILVFEGAKSIVVLFLDIFPHFLRKFLRKPNQSHVNQFKLYILNMFFP